MDAEVTKFKDEIMEQNPAIGKFLQKTTQDLKGYSDTAHLDAELLIGHVLEKPKTYLIAHSERILTDNELEKIYALIQRRKSGEPIAYILGHKEFWSLDLWVTPDVLIPRPETELLVEWALSRLDKNAHLPIADLGVGLGAIALALAHEQPQWIIDGTDSSAKALEIARKNSAKYHLNNVNFYLGHWLEPLPRHDYVAILSNPPYIAADDPHLLNLQFEPRHALTDGRQGLNAIREIIKESQNYLADHGFLVLEHGYNQQAAVVELMQNHGYKDIQDHQDLAGLPRFVTGSKA